MIDSPLIVFLNTYGVVILFVLVSLYIWFYERKKEEVLHVIFAAIIASIIALVLKDLLGIPRPFLSDGKPPLAGYTNLQSFPSLHTTLAFSLATTVALHQRKTGILVFLLAALIGIGRVAANLHYPIDIAGGAVLGTVASLFTEKIHFSISRKRG
ncbi:MAG: Phosphoesterase PA-phosphatase related protein [Candidatus Woesebacteria bacterium GW2011_GWC1_43_10b]|uniref:Phosphatidic acid phosphatase type 2/haloperoxidase domain-containing protein n=2 Tax=Candidatus Woeseibacteriota TaxID=1752722 RepID=A0A0G1JCN4_9BACT|nr:MAG: Phosphoesterase PA-phosphatase related protein [Candidatus Woesebacteria bacterium GW2011_GWC1_43_10b]KKT33129.1 MAG: hypothetical protein UW21_C0014G0003 [Candidatus Woesebacteria bacterium GW2011_GWB1_44_11b]